MDERSFGPNLGLCGTREVLSTGRHSVFLACLWTLLTFSLTAGEQKSERTWPEAMLRLRSSLQSQHIPVSGRSEASLRQWFEVKDAFPVQWDWFLKDAGPDPWQWLFNSADTELEQKLIKSATRELGASGEPLTAALQQLIATETPPTSPAWLVLYERACKQRRAARLQIVRAKAPQIVFTKHHTLRPSFFAYTEGQSDAQNERHFSARAELCLLITDEAFGKTRTLVSDPTGAIRDPAVSWDGTRVTFAWKKSLEEDDYHLYELEVASGKLRQVTSGAGFADYEPAYLPNGDLIFSSTRCVQTVDCWWTEVSNLYTCDTQGRFLRRLGFDQVHAIYPQVMDDGRVTYTRWDYNDRGQIFPQPLFQMYPDGTGQTEFYGNNSWFPTVIAHARGIPETQKVIAILCGHHSSQAGKLAIIDPAKGRQESSGVQLVAPVRATHAERIDSYGQEGELWQYPYPLSEREFIVTFAPLGWGKPSNRRGDADFGIYWMDIDGNRELLAWDSHLPCSQPVPLAARQVPPPWPNRVDYKQAQGVFYVSDVYSGPGLAGVPKGTIKKLRVIALRFRAAGVGQNGSGGPGGGALVSTPVAIGNGTWDVKVILGDAKVHEDGSALFFVPARTPVYFQALDENGYAVQSMRSWSTLQPGEFFGCTGCHENKSAAPPVRHGSAYTLAMHAGPQHLEPFYGPERGFSFVKEVQPVLDRHCIRCHQDRSIMARFGSTASGSPLAYGKRSSRALGDGHENQLAFTLLGTNNLDSTAKRLWSDSYLVLTSARGDNSEDGAGAFAGHYDGTMVRWIGSQSVPEPLPPYFAGAARSELMNLLRTRHQGVDLSREELHKIAAWIDLLVPYCGDYYEANAWSREEMQKYRHFEEKRLKMEALERENLKALAAKTSAGENLGSGD